MMKIDFDINTDSHDIQIEIAIIKAKINSTHGKMTVTIRTMVDTSVNTIISKMV